MSSDLHTHQMDQLDELHTLFAYRFQKWQHEAETWRNELFETEVNDGEVESCKEEPELPLSALGQNAELSQELPWSTIADKERPQTPSSSASSSSSSSSSSSLETERNEPVFTVLDGRELNDIPAVYSVPTLQTYELAAVGVWIDRRIVPGFKYRVRAIENEKYEDDFLFGGNALRLQSIGCGYSRRITFAAGAGELNKNDNYFYSDSRRYGFAFQPELVSVGEKYTIYDVSNHPLGHLEIIQMQYPQVEIKHTVLDDQSVEKMARVRSLAKVEWFDNNEVCVVSVTGNVISIKKKNSHAQVSRISGVTISGHPRRNYTLYPGVDDKQRCITVNGANCHDVPVSYSVVGLENYELPVIGTYVDPRVLPGFCYRVRPINTKTHLFEGRALCLTSIGAGYSKRLTFAPDKNCLNSNGNYFWTDSHPSGFGFELRAIHCGDAFRILAEDRCVGHASVFRVDSPQVEERQTVDKLQKGVNIIKYVHVDLNCLVTIDLSDSEQGTSKICDDRVMRISGTALLQKKSDDKRAKVLRIEDIGLDSQLNVLFLAEHTNVVFEAL